MLKSLKMHLNIHFLLSSLVTIATVKAQGRAEEEQNSPSFPASYPTLSGARRFINGPTSTSVDLMNHMLGRLTPAGLERIGGRVESVGGGSTARWVINGHSYSLNNEDTVLPIGQSGNAGSRLVWRGEATKEGPRSPFLQPGTGLGMEVGEGMPSRTIQLSEAGDVYQETDNSKIFIGESTGQDSQDVNSMPVLKGDVYLDNQEQEQQTKPATETRGHATQASNSTQTQENNTGTDATQGKANQTSAMQNSRFGTVHETQSNGTQIQNKTGTDATQTNQETQATHANQESRTNDETQDNARSGTLSNTNQESFNTQLNNTSNTSQNPTAEKDIKNTNDNNSDAILRSKNPTSLSQNPNRGRDSNSGGTDSSYTESGTPKPGTNSSYTDYDSSIPGTNYSYRDSKAPENPTSATKLIEINNSGATDNLGTGTETLNPGTQFDSQAVIHKSDSNTSNTMIDVIDGLKVDVDMSDTTINSSNGFNLDQKKSGSSAMKDMKNRSELVVTDGSSSVGSTPDGKPGNQTDQEPLETGTKGGGLDGNAQNQTDFGVSETGSSSDDSILKPGSVQPPHTSGTEENITGTVHNLTDFTLHPTLVQGGTTEKGVLVGQSGGTKWQVFQVFIFLSVFGIAVIGFLYWRRRRNMQDDEIPVFTRHTDYQNPTFNMEDATNFMARVGRSSYKTLD